MQKQEFILLIPGIIYGVAIVDLLKVFKQKMYLELLGWSVFAFLVIIQHWLFLYSKLDIIAEENINFLLIILHSILLAKATMVLTPEENDIDTEAYFESIRKPFFILVIVLTIFTIFNQFYLYDDNRPVWWRLMGIGLFVIMIFTKRKWIRYIILIYTLIIYIIATSLNLFSS